VSCRVVSLCRRNVVVSFIHRSRSRREQIICFLFDLFVYLVDIIIYYYYLHISRKKILDSSVHGCDLSIVASIRLSIYFVYTPVAREIVIHRPNNITIQ